MRIVYTAIRNGPVFSAEVFLFALLFFAVPASLFFGFHIVMTASVGLELLRCSRARKVSAGGIPFVSVIVPAKDEAARIDPLLAALRVQDYPNFEIVFVEDRSQDRTPEILRAFAESQPAGRVRILELKENPGPNYKQYALEKGIAAARGDLFLFTDADCEFPPAWIRSMAAALPDSRTALAIGPVYRRVEGESFFDSFQAFDHALRFMYLAGMVGMGVPCGGFGNNIIVSRAGIDAIGGYGAVPFSVTEDAALIAKIRTDTRFRVRAALGADSRVTTGSERSWIELFRQGLRWNNGGLFAPDPTTRLGFGWLMLSILFGVVVLPVVPFFPVAGFASLAAFGVMIPNTIAILAISGRSLGLPVRAILSSLILSPVHFAFLTALGLLRVKVVWKGERLC